MILYKFIIMIIILIKFKILNLFLKIFKLLLYNLLINIYHNLFIFNNFKIKIWILYIKCLHNRIVC